MSPWWVFIVMAAGAIFFLLRPFFRAQRTALARANYDLEVYRAQLKELKSDNLRGLISDPEYEAALIEIERRVLVAGGARDLANHTPAKDFYGRWKIILGLIVVVPLLASGLYQNLGSPQLVDQPLADRNINSQTPSQGEFDQAIEGLVARLKENPNDVEGWTLLARSYGFVARFNEAIGAYREAITLSPDDNDLATAMGESIVFSQDGMVTPSAREQFEKVLTRDPTHQIARYYLGLAHAQVGEREEAFAIWEELASDANPSDTWVVQLQSQLAALSEELGRPVSSARTADKLEPKSGVAASPEPAGPSAADIEAAGEMTVEDRENMIQSMVERLATRLEENPDDPDGWKRLGNARRVLGELAAATSAYGRALAIMPDDLDSLVAQAEIAMEIAGDGTVPPLAEKNYRRVYELDVTRLEAIWYLGLAASQKGRVGEAREHWQLLLEKLPENSDDARAIQRRINELGEGG